VALVARDGGFVACSPESRVCTEAGGLIRRHSWTMSAPAEGHRCPVSDAQRPETPAQAAEVDAFCAAARQAHPGCVAIANNGHDWLAKSRTARDLLDSWSYAKSGGRGVDG
jgi:hypothetical protein